MVCDFCHERNAVIFLEQVSNDGQKRKINLCMECAIQRGISPDPKSIENSIGDLFKELASTSKKIQQDNSRACPVCGISIGEIRKTKLAGCPECYSIFKDDLHKILSSKGIVGKYTGSMPERLSSFRSVLTDRIALRNKLNDAISREDYEKAAMYRDFLKALEKQAVNQDENEPDIPLPSDDDQEKL